MHTFLRHCSKCFAFVTKKKKSVRSTIDQELIELPLTNLGKQTNAGVEAANVVESSKMDETVESAMDESLLNQNLKIADTSMEHSTLETSKQSANETLSVEMERALGGAASAHNVEMNAEPMVMDLDINDADHKSILANSTYEDSIIVVDESQLITKDEVLTTPHDDSTSPVEAPILTETSQYNLHGTEVIEKPLHTSRESLLLTLNNYDNINSQETVGITETQYSLEGNTTNFSEAASILPDEIFSDSEQDGTTSETVKADSVKSMEQVLANPGVYNLNVNAMEGLTEENDVPIPSENYELEYFQAPLIELGRRCWLSSSEVQHYTKGCLWSPDGTCLLVPVHMDGMHVIELPLDLYETSEVPADRPLSDLKSAVHIAEGGTVYDFTWYPHMNSAQPETCFWIATRQHEPILMWDAFDGKLRCTYTGYDDVDEVEAAISLSFSQDGNKIFAGYKKSIKIFDTNRPGRTYENFPVRRAISCIAQTSDNNYSLTCGNWNGFIQHFDLRNPKLGALFTLGGHNGGITHLRFAPVNAGDMWYLYSGARKDNKILQWDLRNYKSPVREFPRNVATNQRIYFDLSAQQNWLASGDTDGKVHVWSLNENAAAASKSDSYTNELEVQLHADCCNGVNFHPMRPILATSSGQYHFFDADSNAASGANSPAQDDNAILPEAELQQATTPEPKFVDYENALLLLWFNS